MNNISHNRYEKFNRSTMIIMEVKSLDSILLFI